MPRSGRTRTPGPPPPLALALVLALAQACGDPGSTALSPDDGPDGPGRDGSLCQLAPSLLADASVGPDAIPALRTPTMVPPDDPSLGYLDDDSRVLGVVIDGEARAYPHNILWWHEIVNDTVAGRAIAVTYCPLTGSGLVFDRGTMGDDPDLGVSGLLFANNLVMYDRKSGGLFGPQMSVSGRCQAFQGVEPALLPVVETTWARWRAMYRKTTVVGGETGYQRNYRAYPYGSYDAPHNRELFVPMPVDGSRPPKELVLGVRNGPGRALLFPFGDMRGRGATAVVDAEVGGRPVTVFFLDEGRGTALAFDRRVEGETLTFEVDGGRVRDRATGTVWTMAGLAVEGPLLGRRLERVEDAYVAFWFAWRHFHPESVVHPPGDPPA